MDEYRVRLPDFHGPLDLLLYLVKKNELDVRDIPIAVIAEQFRDFLDVLQTIDVETVGEFVVTAAALLEIKSRLLLPRAVPLVSMETEEPLDDPRRDLVKQLVDYRRLREAAGRLEQLASTQEQQLARASTDRSEHASEDWAPLAPVELWDLVRAFGRIIQETTALEPQHLVTDDTPQHVHRDDILDAVASAGRLLFRHVFTPPYQRVRMVGIFLAILELIKERLLTFETDGQDEWLVAALQGPNDVPKN